MGWNRTSCFIFDGKSMETETNTWSDFPSGSKAIIEQILALEKINQKVQDCANHSQEFK